MKRIKLFPWNIGNVLRLNKDFVIVVGLNVNEYTLDIFTLSNFSIITISVMNDGLKKIWWGFFIKLHFFWQRWND